MLLKKKLIVFAMLFLLIIPIANAQVCEVGKIKQILRKILYLYFTEPGSLPLTADEAKDMLIFYLTIGARNLTVDCSALGAKSNRPIFDVLNLGDSLPEKIPSCADDTKYGECSKFRPAYCYAGVLHQKCDLCGCPANSVCGKANKCESGVQNVTCFKDIDCGQNGFSGDYSCTNNYISRNYINYTCVNPGTTSSRCVATNSTFFLTYCNPNLNQICVSGQSTCQTTINDSAPTVAISVTPTTVAQGQLFNVTVTGTDDIGLAAIWWWAINSTDVELNKAHWYTCNGIKFCSNSWLVSTNAAGAITLGANSRDTAYPIAGQPHQASEGAGIPYATLTVTGVVQNLTGAPDLVVINLGTYTGTTNTNILISATILNNGTGPAQSTCDGLYVETLNARGFCGGPTLMPGQTKSMSSAFALPVPGTYRVRGDTDYGWWVNESNENNNVVWSTITVTSPYSAEYSKANTDLTVTDIDVQLPTTSSGSTNVYVTTRNLGSLATGQYWVYTKVTNLGNNTVTSVQRLAPVVEPGQTYKTHHGSVGITEYGTYKVEASVDNDLYGYSYIPEFNENNNYMVVTITYGPETNATTSRPDLIVSDLKFTPLNPTTSDLVIINTTVKNIGTATSGSSVLRVDGAGQYWRLTVNSLASGSSNTLQISSYFSAATHVFTATADVDNTISEENENNNVLIKNLTITLTINLTINQTNQTTNQTNVSFKCADSDYGLNYYLNGTTNGYKAFWEKISSNIVTEKDSCTYICSGSVGSGINASGPCLIEYYCDANDYAAFNVYPCPYGCQNGVCVNQTNQTTLAPHYIEALWGAGGTAPAYEGVYTQNIRFWYNGSISNLKSFRLYEKKPTDVAFNLVAEFLNPSSIPSCSSSLPVNSWSLRHPCQVGFWGISSDSKTSSYFPVGEYNYYVAAVDTSNNEARSPVAVDYALNQTTILSPIGQQSTTAPTLRWTVASGWPTTPYYWIKVFNDTVVWNPSVPVSLGSSEGSIIYSGAPLDPTKTYTVYIRASMFYNGRYYLSMNAGTKTFWVGNQTNQTTISTTFSCADGVTKTVDFEDDPQVGSDITWNPDYGAEPQSVASHRAWLNSKGLNISGTPNGFAWSTKISGYFTTGVIIGFASPNFLENHTGLSDNEVLTVNFVQAPVKAVQARVTIAGNGTSTVIMDAYDAANNLVTSATKTFTEGGTVYTPWTTSITASDFRIAKITLRATQYPLYPLSTGVWLEDISLCT